MLMITLFHRESLCVMLFTKAFVLKVHINFYVSYELIDFTTCPNSVEIYCLFILLHAFHHIIYM